MVVKTVEYYSPVSKSEIMKISHKSMDLENIISSKVTQIPKEKHHCMLSLACFLASETRNT